MSTAEKMLAKRSSVGRPQTSYVNNTKLINNLRRENKFWIFLSSSVTFSIILLLVIKQWINSQPYHFIWKLINEIINSGALALALFVLLPMLIKIGYNRLVRHLFTKGMSNQSPITNLLTGIFNTIVNAAILGFFVREIILWKETIQSFENSGVLAKIPVGMLPELPTLQEILGSFSEIMGNFFQLYGSLEFKWQALIALAIISYIIYTGIIIKLIIIFINNLVRSIIAAIQSMTLLPKDRIINNELRFSNYHPHDLPKLEEIYRRTSRWETEATEGEFKNFLQNRDLNISRVILKNWVPVGFYTLNKNRDTVLEMKLHRSESPHQLLKLALEDFTTNALIKNMKAIHYRLNSSKDILNTEEHLVDEKWVMSKEDERGMKTFTKNFRQVEVKF